MSMSARERPTEVLDVPGTGSTEERTVRVLLVEDDAEDAILIREWLADARAAGALLPAVELVHADRLDSAIGFLGERIDLVLLDLHLPDSKGERSVSRLRERAADVPIVVLTVSADDRLAVRALRAGAQDYLVKGRIDSDSLVRSMRYALERHELTRALRASEERLHRMLEANRDGIVLVGEAGRILFVNAAGAEILGREARSLIGCPLDHPLDPFATLPLGERVVEQRVGETVWEGRRAWLVTLRDVTEMMFAAERARRIELRLGQVQKVESLIVLAGGLAHDFNNLLMTILGNVHRARGQLSEGSIAREPLDRIEEASLHGAQLTTQLLAYANRSKIDLVPIDLSQVVAGMADLLRSMISPDARLEVEPDPRPCPALGDTGQVRQVVVNLVRNASEALEGRPGTVRVRTGREDLRREDLDGADIAEAPGPGPYVWLEVADDGGGMDEPTRVRIFDPFFTTKFTGRGLGMAAVLGIVRAHHGAVRVRSAQGRGTTIRVWIPAAGEELREEAPSPKPEPAAEWRGNGTVLVVDDDETVREVFAAILEEVGLRTIQARDGEEALEIWRERGPFDLVLLDSTMPRMGGDETFRRLRELGPVRVVITSGYGERDDLERWQREGLAGFLKKPCTAGDLIEAIRRGLEGEGPSSDSESEPPLP